MKLVTFFLSCLSIWICGILSPAQEERDLPRRGSAGLEGTSFVVAFPQNEIVDAMDEENPQLKIFIASQFPAEIKITYPDQTISYRTLQAGSVHVETIPNRYMVFTSEVPQRKAIFITSDAPVIVYALNSNVASTDTYTAIPIPHLGTEYRAICYPNDRYDPRNTGQDYLLTKIRESEFLVVATENNTFVDFMPSTLTSAGVTSGTWKRFLLQKGECYLVKSDSTLPRGSGDLTGSLVRASQPVAVISGHVRAGVPIAQGGSSRVSTRDHLVEMLPSLDKWGDEFFFTPFQVLPTGDRIRLLAGTPGTRITMSSVYGTRSFNIANAGEFIEFGGMNEPEHITSNHPILVTQFMESALSGANVNVDPAMVVLPATRQYVRSALFRFPQLLRNNTVQNQQFLYYISIVAHRSSLPSLRINNTLVSTIQRAILTQVIPGTEYHWANVRLTEGLFSIMADTGHFSGVMFGLSTYDSYANIYGMSFGDPQEPDITVPVYNLTIDCGRVKGRISDVNGIRPKLEETYVVNSQTNNYRTTISPTRDDNGSVDIDAEVIDLWKPAQIVIHAWDDQGNGREWKYVYTPPDIEIGANLEIPPGTGERCIDVPIRNKGSKVFRIVTVRMVADQRFTLKLKPEPGLRLEPGSSTSIRVCFTPTAVSTSGEARIVVELECGLTKTIIVKAMGQVELAGGLHDFGTVRIGDTTCAMVFIKNTGSSPALINDAVITSLTGPGAWRIAADLNLPLTLNPGDSIGVEVCFSPDSEQGYEWTRRYSSQDGAEADVSFTGSGGRPRIEDVLVDWGTRIIGSVNDTAYVVRNVGSYGAAVTIVDVAGDVGSITTTLVPASMLAAFAVGGQIAIPAAFTPQTPGSYRVTATAVADWLPHDTIRFTFIGSAIEPGAVVADLDFGVVVIGQNRELGHDIIRSVGQADLLISSTEVIGPDAAAFNISPAVANVRSLSTGQSVSDNFRFTPTRVGAHRVGVVFNHSGPSVSDTAWLTGIGIEPERPGLDPRLLTPESAPACMPVEIELSISNTGNTSILVTLESTSPDVTSIVLPVLSDSLRPGETFTWTGPIEFRLGLTDAVVEIVVNGNDGQITTTLRKVIRLIRSEPILSVGPAVIKYFPGDLVTLPVRVTMPAPFQPTQSITFEIHTDKTQFEIANAAGLQATIIEDGRGEVTSTVTAIPQQFGWQLSLANAVRGPSSIAMDITLRTMFSDVLFGGIGVILDETECTALARAEILTYTNVCGGLLRIVSFGSLPLINVRIDPFPVVGNSAVLRIETTKEATVDFFLENIFGQRIELGSRQSLLKGEQSRNLELGFVESGIYSLLVTGGAGAISIPLVLVK